MESCEDSDIDAIVTWVDGSEPSYAHKKKEILSRLEGKSQGVIPAGLDNTRFENNNEIEYCLNSIRCFAPWIRKIFLVTDAQCPQFLDKHERKRLGVTVVDHREIFKGYEDVLPTFNSLSIETMLHRIPGLSNKSLYFNDDVILLGPVEPHDFFDDGRVVLRGEWKTLPIFGPVRLAFSSVLNHLMKKLFGINRAMSVLQQIRAAQLAGAEEQYFKVVHTPHPLRKETLERFFSNFPGALKNNIKHKFRDLSQYAPTGLSNHLEIAHSKASMQRADDALMICFNRDRKSVVARKFRKAASGSVRFLCVQSFEQASPQQCAELTKILDGKVKIERC